MCVCPNTRLGSRLGTCNHSFRLSFRLLFDVGTLFTTHAWGPLMSVCCCLACQECRPGAADGPVQRGSSGVDVNKIYFEKPELWNGHGNFLEASRPYKNKPFRKFKYAYPIETLWRKLVWLNSRWRIFSDYAWANLNSWEVDWRKIMGQNRLHHGYCWLAPGNRE